MKYENLSIVELNQKIVNKEITITDLTKAVLKNIKTFNKENFMANLCEDKAIAEAQNLDKKIVKDNFLYGIPFVMKDNFATKGIKTTSSSKILENFVPTYDSGIYHNLKSDNAIMMGKAALDELGMGGTGLYAATGIITNPRNNKHQVGGSSSGSAW